MNTVAKSLAAVYIYIYIYICNLDNETVVPFYITNSKLII